MTRLTEERINRLAAYFRERTPEPELVDALIEAVRQDERTRFAETVKAYL